MRGRFQDQGDLLAQIKAAPTHSAVRCGIRRGDHQRLKLSHLLIAQRWLGPGAVRDDTPATPSAL